MLRLAGAVEDASEHPVARAVAEAARARFGSLPHVESSGPCPGVGVVGVVEGRRVEIERRRGIVVGTATGRDSCRRGRGQADERRGGRRPPRTGTGARAPHRRRREHRTARGRRGRDRPRAGRGAACREGRGGTAPPGGRRGRGHRRRRNQRRARRSRRPISASPSARARTLPSKRAT